MKVLNSLKAVLKIYINFASLGDPLVRARRIYGGNYFSR